MKIRRVLFCATVDFHITTFHLPYLKYFKEQGYEVHVAAKGKLEIPFCDVKHELPIERSPFKFENIKAYQMLKKIIEQEDFEIIHCHTPMGGIITRLAAIKMRKKGTKVIYTAHGFHFYKGAPLINWLVYYPIEKVLSSLTDCLVTINQEDYLCAVNKHFRAKEIVKVKGVGLDCKKFRRRTEEEYQIQREKFGLKQKFILMYVAELNQNKNQGLLIRSVYKLKQSIPEIHLILVGQGNARENDEQLVKTLGVEQQVTFLGQRRDVAELLKMCDLYCASSLREGLGMNVLEALATGVPVCGVSNRGHREIIQDGENGFLIDSNEEEEFARRILYLYQDKTLYQKMAEKASFSVKEFSVEETLKTMQQIYEKYRR